MSRTTLVDVYGAAVTCAGCALLVTMPAGLLFLAGHKLFDNPSSEPLPALRSAVTLGAFAFLGAVLVAGWASFRMQAAATATLSLPTHDTNSGDSLAPEPAAAGWDGKRARSGVRDEVGCHAGLLQGSNH